VVGGCLFLFQKTDFHFIHCLSKENRAKISSSSFMRGSNTGYTLSSNTFYLGDNVLLCTSYVVRVFYRGDVLSWRPFVGDVVCILSFCMEAFCRGDVMSRRRFVCEPNYRVIPEGKCRKTDCNFILNDLDVFPSFFD
jgi:hypothetical protein